MNYRYLIIALCLCYCCCSGAAGQVHENALPYSASESLPAVTHFEELPPPNLALHQNASPQGFTKFAYPIFTNLTPHHSGQWSTTPRGRVWRIGIRSDQAYSLYLKMHFLLSPGAKLFVYGPEYQDLRGAFTHRNNNAAKVLTIAPIRGDRLIIELNLPHTQASFGELKIQKVFYDFANIFNAAAQARTSYGCDEDINCTNGRYWQTEKRSVCKIITNGFVGTGTLIGNTSGSNTPYVLTAYHIISSPELAAETVFIFNHETTACGESLTSSVKSLSGATLVATTDHRVDFTLLKLYEAPPPAYQPYYAGWDARNIIPQKSVCIHHPFGGEKQISIEYHPLRNEDIGKGFDANSTWKVSHWEVGTTELGSSGAALFNEQHRIVGTLTGGRSTCGYARDDYFTKFSAAWDAYSEPSNQLKHWLDAAQTGKLILNGYDPYGFNAQHCDTAWNYSAHEKLGLSKKGLAWGWLSGHSSAGFTQFAERFESAGLLQINGAYLNVAKAHASHPLASIALKVWEGAEHPEKEVYSKLVFIKDFQPKKIHYVAFDTVLKNSGPLYVGYQINYQTVSDTFALYHTPDRGPKRSSSMCLFKEGWYQSADKAAFGMSLSLGLGISQCYGASLPPASNLVNVYPNPCSNFLTLDIPERLPIHEVKCFDSYGRSMPVSLKQTEDGNKLYFDLPTGLYHLKIITQEKSFAARFLVLKE